MPPYRSPDFLRGFALAWVWINMSGLLCAVCCFWKRIADPDPTFRTTTSFLLNVVFSVIPVIYVCLLSAVIMFTSVSLQATPTSTTFRTVTEIRTTALAIVSTNDILFFSTAYQHGAWRPLGIVELPCLVHLATVMALCGSGSGTSSCSFVPDSIWSQALALAVLGLYVWVVFKLEAYVASQSRERDLVLWEGREGVFVVRRERELGGEEEAPLLGDDACAAGPQGDNGGEGHWLLILECVSDGVSP